MLVSRDRGSVSKRAKRSHILTRVLAIRTASSAPRIFDVLASGDGHSLTERLNSLRTGEGRGQLDCPAHR